MGGKCFGDFRHVGLCRKRRDTGAQSKQEGRPSHGKDVAVRGRSRNPAAIALVTTRRRLRMGLSIGRRHRHMAGLWKSGHSGRKVENGMSWTDERVELLKKMWGEGQSASQIAKELGGVTRNAVIGKVHRLGLSNRSGGGGASSAKSNPAETDPPKAAKPAKSATPKPAPTAAPKDDAKADPAPAERPSNVTPLRKPIVPAGQPLPPQPSANEISPEALAKQSEVEKHAKRLTLMELTERTCKWPIGDPATDDFYFCGLPVQQGKPYCDAHVGVAFQPMSARRDRRR
jgi:GcrA cell cycle regulator